MMANDTAITRDVTLEAGPDGALFTLDGELSSDGAWAPIRGPGRLKGWMATEFLEFTRD